MFLPLRYSIHGLFEIGFRFVVRQQEGQIFVDIAALRC
jgi:hypothetical protein